MPVRTKKKAKKAKPVKKKRPVKAKAKRKVTAKKRPAKKGKAKKAKKPAVLAQVTHYYDRIGVAILKLKAPLRVGDFVVFRRNGQEFTQPVSSLQVDHAPVTAAKRGVLVGIKVKEAVKEGTVVVPA